MKKFFRFGSKNPVSFSLFITVLSFFVFIIACSAAGFFTRENVSEVVVIGAKVLFLICIALTITFEVLALKDRMQNEKWKKLVKEDALAKEKLKKGN